MDFIMSEEKIKINLFDSLGDHFYKEYGFWGMTPFIEPSKVEWIKPGLREFDGITVFTDNHLHGSFVDMIDSKFKVALLNECPTIHRHAYDHILRSEDRFDYILTYEQSLLDRGEKYILNPIGTSRVKDEDAKIYEKTKLVSLIASRNSLTRGHRLRHRVAKAIIDDRNPKKVEFWGRNSYKTFPEGGKAAVLKDYHFDIVIENAKHTNYFTEKIVDNFRTGTVPIYWGCKNIGDFFNEKGIIKFETPAELINILKNLTTDEYRDKFEYVKENFERAKNWVCMDDNSFDNIKKTGLI
ncbi:MAG TPA: hypothetical protein DF712_23065 [Balneola sp.]|nr:hypothetical protein [Balneola sp.]